MKMLDHDDNMDDDKATSMCWVLMGRLKGFGLQRQIVVENKEEMYYSLQIFFKNNSPMEWVGITTEGDY